MRSPVTQLIQQFNALTPEEAKVFLDLVDPQVEPEKQKRTRAKRGTKSKRASGMAETIKNSLEAQQQANADNDDEGDETGPLCGVCGNIKDYQDHFKPSPNYHKFDGPKPVGGGRRSSKKSESTLPEKVDLQIDGIPESAIGVGAGE